MIYTSTTFYADSLLAATVFTEHRDGTYGLSLGESEFNNLGYICATADDLRAIADHFRLLADEIDERRTTEVAA